MSTSGDFLLLPDYYIAEYEAAKFIVSAMKNKCKPVKPLTDGLKFKQPQAVEYACKYPVSILTGPPGTGKTTTLKRIVDSYVAAGLQGITLTPTGKAGKRADIVINQDRNFVERIECSTIQSGLKYNVRSGEYTYNRSNRLPFDFVIFEEFSMNESILLRDAVESVKPDARIVFSGDQYQLPSVGAGNVSRDLIECEIIPATELDVVLRTGPNSGITHNANRILRGQELSKMDELGNLFTDFYFVPRDGEKKTVESILKWVTETLPQKYSIDPLIDIQVISPAKNGEVGVKNLNEILRRSLNKNLGNKKKMFGRFCVGDKVINNANNKKLGIVNGDTGIIKSINICSDENSDTTITVDFGSGAGLDRTGIVNMNMEQASDLSEAYCFTTHKSQGSEFPVVIMPIHQCHVYSLTRQLLYTGLTRARQLGILIGDRKTLKAAISNVGSLRRRTALKSFIKAEYKKAA